MDERGRGVMRLDPRGYLQPWSTRLVLALYWLLVVLALLGLSWLVAEVYRTRQRVEAAYREAYRVRVGAGLEESLGERRSWEQAYLEDFGVEPFVRIARPGGQRRW